MKWTLPELFAELEQDSERRIVFVEGDRDLQFWRDVMPAPSRGGGVVVYPISVIECASVEGGQRGRLLWCAQQFLATEFSTRGLFFADADWDRILARTHAPNVVWTDWRDLESYGNSASAIGRIGTIGFQRSAAQATQIFELVMSAVRPVAYLRVASERNSLGLPFQETFKNGRLPRYFVANDYRKGLNETKLLTALLHNAQISLTKRTSIEQLWNAERLALSGLENRELVHGKDLVRTLASAFGVTEEVADALFFLNLDYLAISALPAPMAVRNWAT